MKLTENTVLILGAGFTKAFLPKAPLLVDNYNEDQLSENFSKFPWAYKILKNEIEREPQGKVNLERLMTRLHSQMPYDNYEAEPELTLLLSKLKSVFKERIQEARKDSPFEEVIKDFARLCVDKKINCITFNYDDFFDQKLWEVEKLTYSQSPQKLYWHPDGGYGYFCKPSDATIRTPDVFMDRTSMLLLKLHGSMNWRIRKGDLSPYTIDSILHNEDWLKRSYHPTTREDDNEIIELHLEPESFIVPPVLTKDALSKQPLLKLVWSLAHEKLKTADNVIFIGYSLPRTDIASEFLFSETISADAKVWVVNHGSTQAKKNEIRKTYRRMFPRLPNNRFKLDGALEWINQILQENSTKEKPAD